MAKNRFSQEWVKLWVVGTNPCIPEPTPDFFFYFWKNILHQETHFFAQNLEKTCFSPFLKGNRAKKVIFPGMSQGVKTINFWCFEYLQSQIPSLKSQISSLRSKILSLRFQVSDLKPQISGLRSQFSSFRSQVPDLKFQISILWSQVPDLKSQISSLKSQVLDLKLQTSSLRLSDLKYQTLRS